MKKRELEYHLDTLFSLAKTVPSIAEDIFIFFRATHDLMTLEQRDKVINFLLPSYITDGKRLFVISFDVTKFEIDITLAIIAGPETTPSSLEILQFLCENEIVTDTDYLELIRPGISCVDFFQAIFPLCEKYPKFADAGFSVLIDYAKELFLV